MDCLRGLVGLSPDDSVDFGPIVGAVDHPDYKTSSLNLWTWGLVGPNLLADGRMDPVETDIDVWKVLADAYEAALVQLPKEVAGFLGNRLQPAFDNLNNRLGEVATTGVVAVPSGLAGFALPTKNLKGGVLTISKLGVMLNRSVSNLMVTVTRYDGPLPVSATSNLTSYLNNQYLVGKTGEVMRIWDIDVASMDSRSYAVSPLDLPLDGSIYTISYTIGSGFLPMNNRLSCGCGGKDKAINGILTTPIGAINGDQAHGLLLDVKSSCDFSGIVCDLLMNNQYTAALGHMLYYKTGLNVLSDLLGGKLSSAIQIQKDDLLARQADWEVQMSTYMTWMTSNFEPSLLPVGNCYLCSKVGQIYRGTINL